MMYDTNVIYRLAYRLFNIGITQFFRTFGIALNPFAQSLGVLFGIAFMAASE